MSAVGLGSGAGEEDVECVVLDSVPPHATSEMLSPRAIALNLVIRSPFHRVDFSSSDMVVGVARGYGVVRDTRITALNSVILRRNWSYVY